MMCSPGTDGSLNGPDYNVCTEFDAFIKYYSIQKIVKYQVNIFQLNLIGVLRTGVICIIGLYVCRTVGNMFSLQFDTTMV